MFGWGLRRGLEHFKLVSALKPSWTKKHSWLTRAILDGREVLGTGLGLGALRLIRFGKLGSDEAAPRPVAGVNALLGRLPFRAAVEAGRDGGG